MKPFTKCLLLGLLVCFQPFSSIAQQKTVIAVYNLSARAVALTDVSIITDRLRSELIKTNKFDVMERDMMEEILEEQAIQLTGLCDEASCLVEVGKMISVKQMVGGSIGKIGNIYSMQVRLVDVETGKVLKTVEEDYHGSIELLLTNVTPRVARKLAGLTEEGFFDFGAGNNDLYVESQPEGAIIYINSQPTGKITPATIVGLERGNYNVVLRKDNLYGVQQISLTDGELKHITLPLSKARGNVRVITEPGGAQVFYNRQYKGLSPLSFDIDIEAEDLPVMITMNGYMSETIVPEFGERLSYRINKILKPAGTLEVTSEPSNTAVYLNNKLLKRTPVTYDQIPYGKNELKLVHQDYLTSIITFEVSKEEPNHRFHIPLEQKKAIFELNGIPLGAKVYLDGDELGSIPLKNEDIPFGEHTLAIEKNGYYNYEEQINIKYEDIRIDNFSLEPKSKGLAIFYSTILPGSGQIYSGYTLKGYTLGIASLGGLALSLWSYQSFTVTKDEYNKNKEAYENNTDLNKMEYLRNEMNSSYDQLEQSKKINDIAVVATSALWLYNIFDAYLFFPKIENISLGISSMKNSSTIGLTVNF